LTLPLVALVGRPNVGKSTLFNRIVGARLAIVEDVPGTTRDRLYARTEWGGREFNVVDTGGLELRGEGEITIRVRNQAEVAIAEADVIVLLADGKEGLTSADHDVAGLLRRSGKPVILAVNKAESRRRQLETVEFWNLGVGEPYAVSALHGTGTGDLLQAVVDALPDREAPIEDEAVRVAILGRPNVGKSSLLNKLSGEQRMIVSAVPGTTRDAVDTRVVHDGQEIVLVDTAGVRRSGKVAPGVERYSVLRAMRAIERADVGILMLDAQDGVTAQDAHIGGYIDAAGKGAIIAVNKWDLVEKDTHTAAQIAEVIRAELKFLDYAPILFISALTGQRARQVLVKSLEIQAERQKRIPTAELNRFVADTLVRHAPPSKGGRRLKVRFATQAGLAPPTFVFFVNDRELVHFGYERFIDNQLRRLYPFEGTPIRLVFREREDRHAGK